MAASRYFSDWVASSNPRPTSSCTEWSKTDRQYPVHQEVAETTLVLPPLRVARTRKAVR